MNRILKVMFITVLCFGLSVISLDASTTVKDTNYSNGTIKTKTYYENGKRTKKIEYNTSGKKEIMYTFQSNGRVYTKYYYNTRGEQIRSYRYDTSGRKQSAYDYGYFNETRRIIKRWDYNTKGQKTRYQLFNETGLDLLTIIKYKDGKMNHRIDYQITYPTGIKREIKVYSNGVQQTYTQGNKSNYYYEKYTNYKGKKGQTKLYRSYFDSNKEVTTITNYNGVVGDKYTHTFRNSNVYKKWDDSHYDRFETVIMQGNKKTVKKGHLYENGNVRKQRIAKYNSKGQLYEIKAYQGKTLRQLDKIKHLGNGYTQITTYYYNENGKLTKKMNYDKNKFGTTYSTIGTMYYYNKNNKVYKQKREFGSWWYISGTSKNLKVTDVIRFE